MNAKELRLKVLQLLQVDVSRSFQTVIAECNAPVADIRTAYEWLLDLGIIIANESGRRFVDGWELYLDQVHSLITGSCGKSTIGDLNKNDAVWIFEQYDEVYALHTVEKVTKTQVRVWSDNYRKRDGYRIGAGSQYQRRYTISKFLGDELHVDQMAYDALKAVLIAKRKRSTLARIKGHAGYNGKRWNRQHLDHIELFLQNFKHDDTN